MATPKLTLVRHESPDGPTCPAFYATSRATFPVVGKKVSDPAVLAQMGIASDEAVVEIPMTLLPELTTDAS
jgi:hypothetical protein